MQTGSKLSGTVDGPGKDDVALEKYTSNIDNPVTGESGIFFLHKFLDSIVKLHSFAVRLF